MCSGALLSSSRIRVKNPRTKACLFFTMFARKEFLWHLSKLWSCVWPATRFSSQTPVHPTLTSRYETKVVRCVFPVTYPSVPNASSNQYIGHTDRQTPWCILCMFLWSTPPSTSRLPRARQQSSRRKGMTTRARRNEVSKSNYILTSPPPPLE